MNLSQLLQGMYGGIGMFESGIATGGSATTIVDSARAGVDEDDAYKGSTAFVVKDTAGASPEGKFAIVTSYTGSSGTFTFSTVTDAIAAGDIYGIASDEVPLYDAIRLANDALRDMGTIESRDTSLTTAANQTDYEVPVTAKGRILEVNIETDSTHSDAPGYVTVPGCKYINTAGASTGIVRLPYQPPSGYTLELVYAGLHPVLSAYGDSINENILEGYAVAAAVERAVRWLVDRDRGANTFWNAKLKISQGDLDYWRGIQPPLATRQANYLSLTNA
jgi:hypothetical protein